MFEEEEAGVEVCIKVLNQGEENTDLRMIYVIHFCCC